MKWIVATLGLLMAAAGGYWSFTGSLIVQVERGWSAVIAGAVVFSAGMLILAIAALMGSVDRLTRVARARETAKPRPAPSAPLPTVTVASAPVAAAAFADAPKEPAAQENVDKPQLRPAPEQNPPQLEAINKAPQTAETPALAADVVNDPEAQAKPVETAPESGAATAPPSPPIAPAPGPRPRARPIPPPPPSYGAGRPPARPGMAPTPAPAAQTGEASGKAGWLEQAVRGGPQSPPSPDKPQPEIKPNAKPAPVSAEKKEAQESKAEKPTQSPPEKPVADAQGEKDAAPAAAQDSIETPQIAAAKNEPAKNEVAKSEVAKNESAGAGNGKDQETEPAKGQDAAPKAVEKPAPEPASAPDATAASSARITRRYESQGVRYTLFEDGSIDAESPNGRFRFASLDELRLFLEKKE